MCSRVKPEGEILLPVTSFLSRKLQTRSLEPKDWADGLAFCSAFKRSLIQMTGTTDAATTEVKQ